MLKLAESSGTVVYENNNKLYFYMKPASWSITFLFVSGLLAFILLSNGILQLFLLDQEGSSAKEIGLGLSALGILFLIIFWRIYLFRKKLNKIEPAKLKSICVIDFTENAFIDGQGNLLTSLDSLRLSRRFQFGSSSPALELRWDKRSITIVKGNPFSGGISAVEKLLKLKGIQK